MPRLYSSHVRTRNLVIFKINNSAIGNLQQLSPKLFLSNKLSKYLIKIQQERKSEISKENYLSKVSQGWQSKAINGTKVRKPLKEMTGFDPTPLAPFIALSPSNLTNFSYASLVGSFS